MKKMIAGVKGLLLILLLGILILGQPLVGSGEESVETEKNVELGGVTGFTYKLEYPDNQLSADAGYFDLLVAPQQEQELQLVLSNPGAEAITVNIGLNGAKTNANGVIDYGETSIADDESLAMDFKEVVSGPEQVELAAGESKTVQLLIKMPATAFEGVLAGGIQLMKADTAAEGREADGSAVVNRYAYVIALLLRESAVEVAPELALREVYAGQDNYRSAIIVKLANIKAAYLNEMMIEVQITEKDKQKVLYERRQEEMRMAPNTAIAFPVYLEGAAMEAGEYEARITVTGVDLQQEWQETFTITQTEAEEYNQRSAGLSNQKKVNWSSVALGTGLFFLLVAFVFGGLQFWRKRQQLAARRRGPKRRRKNIGDQR